MSQFFSRVLARMWNRFAGVWQWYVLWLWHDKFIVGVSGVITNARGDVLLLRHRYRKHEHWGLPSGYAERGETLQGALAREIAEETGYKAEIGALLKVTSGFKLRIEVSFCGVVTGGNLRLDTREVLEARFFAVDELPAAMLKTHRALIALAVAEKGSASPDGTK